MERGSQAAAFFVSTAPLQTQKPENALPATTFRINSCESVSKYATLTAFRMNVYKKHGESQVARLSFPHPFLDAQQSRQAPFPHSFTSRFSGYPGGTPRSTLAHHGTANLGCLPLLPHSPTTGQGKVPGSANYRSRITIALSKPIAEDLLQPIPGSTYAQCYRK